MKVLTVLPITHNQQLGELTYFSLKDIPLGSVVDVKLRNKNVPTLVVDSADASDMKAILRGNNFALKRLEATSTREVLTPAFIKAANIIAKYYATTTGSVIASATSSVMLSCPDLNQKTEIDAFKKHVHDAYALQAPLLERITVYKNTARESLARNKSVIIVAPNVITAERLYIQLQPGIEDRTHLLSSKVSKPKLQKIITTATNSTSAQLLITTPKFASLNVHNLGTIIIEQESSIAYNTLKRPYINLAKFISEYAKAMRVKLILADTTLSMATSLAMRNGEVCELAPLSTRQRSKVRVKIIDTRVKKSETKIKNKKNTSFEILDETVKQHISKSIKDKKRVLLLTQRSGLAPITICRDCNSAVTCTKCDTPLTLYKNSDTTREFLCNKCGLTTDSDTTCSYCNSWRLDTLGIGIELVEDELKKLYKKTNIIRIDKKTTKTDTAIKKALHEFDTKGGLLLATSIVLPFIEEVDSAVVVSIDSMLSVPSFNIDERVFSMLIKLKELAKNSLYIQTRMPQRAAITMAVSGDISDFIRQELALRKALKYPPYTTMIKITATGTKKRIIEEFQKVIPKLEPYGPRVFKQFQRLSPTKFALHALIRVDYKKWPDEELLHVLKSLQPQFEVKINIE